VREGTGRRRGSRRNRLGWLRRREEGEGVVLIAVVVCVVLRHR